MYCIVNAGSVLLILQFLIHKLFLDSLRVEAIFKRLNLPNKNCFNP